MSEFVRVSRPYFVCDPNGDGIEFHETEAAALSDAADLIATYIDSDGSWMSDADCITVGMVTHRATAEDHSVNGQKYREYVMRRAAPTAPPAIRKTGEWTTEQPIDGACRVCGAPPASPGPEPLTEEDREALRIATNFLRPMSLRLLGRVLEIDSAWADHYRNQCAQGKEEDRG